MNKDWSIDIARKLYGIENYVRGDVITIDEEGYLIINLHGEKLRINEIMNKYNLDIAYFRILPLIKKSMDLVYNSFKLVSDSIGFNKKLIPVFPMKVNPLPLIIESIMKYGEEYNWGFNTGSIGEVRLLQNISSMYSPRTLIYDGVVTDNIVEELIKLHKLGWRIIIDIESEHDAEILAKYPQIEIGIRIKPITRLHGKWSSSTGLSGKFGFTTNLLAKVSDEYKWVRERAVLLHMHPGSQVYRFTDIMNYFNEVSHVYERIREMGFENIDTVDPGGGMAYPYIDIRDGEEESPDYTIVDYFRQLLESLKKVKHTPNVIFEGGRFIVSAHRILVAKVIDVRPYSAIHSPNGFNYFVDDIKNIDDIREVLKRLGRLASRLRKESTIDETKREAYEHLVALLREDIASKIAELVLSNKMSIKDSLSDKRITRIFTTPTKRFILNMSIFADIPDSVLVDQYFQVVPTQRLHEKPSILATLSDLTCDSMGELTRYISAGNLIQGETPLFTELDSRLIAVPGVKLKLHGVPLYLLSKDENYYVAFLDTGAYQDTLAMRHNLIYGAPEVLIDIENNEITIKIVKHEDLYT